MLLALSACVVGLLCGTHGLSHHEPSIVMDTHLKQSYLFAYTVFQQLASESSANVALSAGALLNSLAMLYEGSGGGKRSNSWLTSSTSRPIRNSCAHTSTASKNKSGAICQSANQTRLVAGYSGAFGNYARVTRFSDPITKNVTCLGSRASVGPRNSYKTATRLFVASHVHVTPGFTTLLDTFYPTSGVELVNFSSSKATAGRINWWVNERTNGSIPSIVEPESLNDETEIVLVSVEYFRGLWATPFNPDNTRNLTFHVSDNETVEVPTMHARGDYEVVRVADGGYSLLKLPYQDSKLACVFVLPDEGKSLSEVLDETRGSFLTRPGLFDGIEPQNCEIFLPRFTLEASVNLAPVFSKMDRLGNLFSRPANFSAIVQDRLLNVDSITQKTRVQMDEFGTTAAAVQEVDISWKMWDENCRFVANRPFAFVLQLNYHDDADNIPVPLVVGRVSRPDATPKQ